MNLDEATEIISEMRESIDATDSEIRELIGDRNDAVAALMSIKRAAGLPVWDQKRYDEVIDGYVEDLGDAETNPFDGVIIATAIMGTQEQLETLYG